MGRKLIYLFLVALISPLGALFPSTKPVVGIEFELKGAEIFMTVPNVGAGGRKQVEDFSALEIARSSVNVTNERGFISGVNGPWHAITVVTELTENSEGTILEINTAPVDETRFLQVRQVLGCFQTAGLADSNQGRQVLVAGETPRQLSPLSQLFDNYNRCIRQTIVGAKEQSYWIIDTLLADDDFPNDAKWYYVSTPNNQRRSIHVNYGVPLMNLIQNRGIQKAFDPTELSRTVYKEEDLQKYQVDSPMYNALQLKLHLQNIGDSNRLNWVIAQAAANQVMLFAKQDMYKEVYPEIQALSASRQGDVEALIAMFYAFMGVDYSGKEDFLNLFKARPDMVAKAVIGNNAKLRVELQRLSRAAKFVWGKRYPFRFAQTENHKVTPDAFERVWLKAIVGQEDGFYPRSLQSAVEIVKWIPVQYFGIDRIAPGVVVESRFGRINRGFYPEATDAEIEYTLNFLRMIQRLPD